MFMNLTQLQTELRYQLKARAVSASRLTTWLNQAQDDVAMLVQPAHLRQSMTLTTVDGTSLYYLPSIMLDVLHIVDTTNDRILRPVTEYQNWWWDPDVDDTGNPEQFSKLGTARIEGQPSSASVVTIVSSSASDTTQKVRVNGTVSGVDDTELLTLNGTSSVAGSKSFTALHSITRDNTTTGRVTATTNSGGVTVATFAPNELGITRQMIRLFPVPAGAYSLNVFVVKPPRRMVNAEDAPDFPDTFLEMIQVSAKIRGHRDLYEHAQAAAVQEKELIPLLSSWMKANGKRPGPYPPFLRLSGMGSGRLSIGRLPWNYPNRY